VSLGEFNDLVGRLLDELPDALLDELNGGVIVESGAKVSPEARGVLILGEYHQDAYLGRLIVLYYGSFVHVLRRAGREVWEDELRKTLRHEIRHHLEERAGLRDLRREDREQLKRFLGL